MLSALACSPVVSKITFKNQIFNDNIQYIAWELRRIQRRVVAYIEAKTPQQHQKLLALVEAQEAERAEAISQRQALRQRGEVIPFDLISRTYGISPVEEDLLWVSLAPHLCLHTHKLLLHAQSLAGAQALTAGFVADLICPDNALFCARFWLSSESRLVTSGLLERAASGATLLGGVVQAPQFVASACMGSLGVDPRIASFAELCVPSVGLSEVVLPAQTERALNAILGAFCLGRQRDAAPAPLFLVLSGPSGVGKTSLADALCGAQKRLRFSIDGRALAREPDLASRLALALQNASFCDAALHIDGLEVVLASHPSVGTMLRQWFQNDAKGLLILETESAQALLPLLGSPPHGVLHVPPPDAVTRIALWESLLPLDIEPSDDLRLAHIASTYPLTGHQIRRAIDAACARAQRQGRAKALTSEDLCFGASLQIQSQSEHANTLASSASHGLTLRDIVLPPETRSELEALLGACRSRTTLMHDWGFQQKLATGRGVTALLHGEPGTGKTLSAEILAREAGMGIIIVSIPHIVSKWLGETEKQLHNLFAQAQAQNAILFFDEADSLFSKRVNVERGQDHYQNMSINHLLQEVERFDGVLLLSTNLENNMDPAFARRILFKINFPMPDATQREAIWKTLIPAQTPKEALDFKELARNFELSGGYIKNAIIRAAYQCAASGRALSQESLQCAAYEQCRASGKLSRAPHR